MTDAPLLTTPLHALHRELGAKMVPFAGYDMPVQYPMGVLGEHLHTRAKAGLFDVSHMGQAYLIADDWQRAAKALESLTPTDLMGLAPGQSRYSLLLTEQGGIIDDFMTSRPSAMPDRLFLVVNAACKDGDFAHIAAKLQGRARLERLDDRALLALQGPMAATVLARHCADSAGLTFMTGTATKVAGVDAYITRSGYTGEDGYEISIPARDAERIARLLLAEPEVAPIGLGARDSLRLEAGLCLYGHDISLETSPVEANLSWAIAKRRREEGNFPGAQRILTELKEKPTRRRVGILPEGRAPAREGTPILDAAGNEVGVVTSGGFGPTLNGPVAMGYVATAHAAAGTALSLLVRGKPLPARVAPMPFVPNNYVR